MLSVPLQALSQWQEAQQPLSRLLTQPHCKTPLAASMAPSWAGHVLPHVWFTLPFIFCSGQQFWLIMVKRWYAIGLDLPQRNKGKVSRRIIKFKCYGSQPVNMGQLINPGTPLIPQNAKKPKILLPSSLLHHVLNRAKWVLSQCYAFRVAPWTQNSLYLVLFSCLL